MIRWHRVRPDPPGAMDAELAGTLAAQLDRAAQARLGRSLGLLHLPAGGCGGCAMELRMLHGAVYDLERLGLHFVETPAQADVLLLSGAVTRAMAGAAARAWEAAADPKWAVALGGCAIDGGPFAGLYPVLGGADAVLPVSLAIPGCPPTPAAILAGLRTLVEANG